MRFVVDPWAPEYGAPAAGELTPTASVVDVGVEVAPERWAARHPFGVAPAGRVRFVDGVRRVDAHVWIDSDDGMPHQGLAASYAAGVVCCEGKVAALEACTVRRGLFSAAPDVSAITTPHVTYPPRRHGAESTEELVARIQRVMRQLEAEVAAPLAHIGEVDLLVVDGPLGTETLGRRAVGYIKTHQAGYLPTPHAALVRQLRVGERTPLFLTTARWSRYSWYVRLPGGGPSAWSGIARAEASGDLDPVEAARLADLVTVTLPRYASTPVKDPRAPQNLHPIADLERRLRHHLGDQAVLYRALSLAAGRRS
jgi:hypothetical protein